MRAADIDFATLLEFVPEQGKLLLNGQRMLLFSQVALGTLDQVLVDHLGHEFARALFAQFGYRCGYEDYHAIAAVGEWDSEADRIASGPVIHMWEGIVHVESTHLEYDRAAGEFEMIGIWRNSYQAENHMRQYGPARYPVCSALTGYASGWASGFLGEPLLAIETQCAATGAPDCRFQIRPVARWDGRADPWRDALTATSSSISSTLEALVRQRTSELESLNASLEQARAVAEAARAAAEAADRAKSAFLARMSHELRTPMNGVIGGAQLLRASLTDPAALELVDLIIESGNQQVAIITDLLDYSGLEAGAVPVKRAPVVLRDLLTGVVTQSQEQAQRRGVDLGMRIDVGVPERGLLDASKVRQILAILVGNAIKFTAPPGAVTVGAYVGQAPDGQPELVVAVRDTGIGMSREQLSRLFTPFMQGDDSVTRTHGGTGLGLVIAQKLAGLMDGRLDVRSQPGVGSTISLVLPLSSGPPRGSGDRAASGDRGAPAANQTANSGAGPLPGAGSGAPPSAQELSVLVAEDNPINARVVRRMLEGLGARVTVVGDGEQALTAFGGGGFDLVLLDLHMPVLDGLHTVRALRSPGAGPGSQRVPVVALTADVSGATRQECLAAGFTSFLTKPLERARLVDLLSGIRSPGA